MTAPNETPPDDEAIKKLLEELRSKESHHRWGAAESIAQLKTSNEEIINALKARVIYDSNNIVRQAAYKALVALGHTPPLLVTINAEPEPPFYQQPDFWLGFIGWYVFNGIFGACLWLTYPVTRDVGSIAFIFNAGALLIGGTLRSNIARGMLAAIASIFAFSVLFGVFIAVTCSLR